MRIRQVDFPDEVIKAQRTGNLVIFAGAGVSMDPPSNYPDFNALAAKIGSGINPRLDHEPIDRYLGRLKGLGVTVHSQVGAILSSPRSQPNPLHDAIVGLFKNSETVRLVSTNFDRHFSTTAKTRFGPDCPEIFTAPALPVGNNFSGIVYIHGSVDKPSEGLVLTDADFGRAYVTEAWATQFLQRLFSRYVVLFVGYSHQDMPMNYLARGLSPASPGPGRFVLTLPDGDARWRNLGITPVHYPAGLPPEPKHAHLGLALSAWAEQSRAGALDVERRVKIIVETGLPLAPEDTDFLQHALAEVSTLRFFTRHATKPMWLEWIEPQAVFERLFSHASDGSQSDSELAYWFSSKFAFDFPNNALDLVRRKHLRLSPTLWTAIAHVLFQRKPGGGVLSRWVSVLLATLPPSPNTHLLQYVMSDCQYPDDEEAALLLLDHLTTPAIELRGPYPSSDADSGSKPTTRIDLKTVGEELWLTGRWAGYFSPHLNRYGQRLAVLVTSKFNAAHVLLEAFESTSDSWDPVSQARGMVESRQQDHLHNGWSAVIDIAAGVMNWACHSDHRLADGLISQWSVADSPLLRRLALYGVSVAEHLAADAKLTWLEASRLLFRPGMKHEVFLLLKGAYPNASREVRRVLLEQVIEGRTPAREEGVRDDYEIFNMLGWLSQADPDCALVGKELARMREKRPEFVEHEHPDLDSWMGGWTWGGNSVAASDLSGYSLDKLLLAFAEGADSEFRGDASKAELRQSVAESGRNNFGWDCDRRRSNTEGNMVGGGMGCVNPIVAVC